MSARNLEWNGYQSFCEHKIFLACLKSISLLYPISEHYQLNHGGDFVTLRGKSTLLGPEVCLNPVFREFLHLKMIKQMQALHLNEDTKHISIDLVSGS